MNTDLYHPGTYETFNFNFYITVSFEFKMGTEHFLSHPLMGFCGLRNQAFVRRNHEEALFLTYNYGGPHTG